MSKDHFLSVALNPTLQRTIIIDRFQEDEVNRTDEVYFDVAGKGVNTSRVLSQLGESVWQFTHTGGKFRDIFVEMARADGVEIRDVRLGCELRMCYTLINRGSGTATEIAEEARPVPEGSDETVFESYLELLSRSHTIIFSGSRARGFRDDIYTRMIEAAKAEGAEVILDIRGDDLSRAIHLGPDIIKPNFFEFAQTFFPDYVKNLDIGEHDEDEELCTMVGQKMLELEESGITTVLTRGKRSTLYPAKENIAEIRPEVVANPVNAIGSGDAFTAGFASARFNGEKLEAAIRKGHECGRKNTLQIRPGTLR